MSPGKNYTNVGNAVSRIIREGAPARPLSVCRAYAAEATRDAAAHSYAPW